jgi:hypothetical protein
VVEVLHITSGAQEGTCFLVQQPDVERKPGGIVRALAETFARETAVLYAHLQQVYDSSFVDTAEGEDLTGVLTLVELAAEPDVVGQADISVTDPGVGKLVVETSVRDVGHEVLPKLDPCVTVRLHGAGDDDDDDRD